MAKENLFCYLCTDKEPNASNSAGVRMALRVSELCGIWRVPGAWHRACVFLAGHAPD